MKANTEHRRGRLTLVAASVLALALALALPACSSNSADETSPNAPKAEDAGKSGNLADISDEDLVIVADDISETPKFYPVTVDGTKMEVFAVRTEDGQIRTAFNTCQVCNGSPKAYFEQSGDAVRCQNCGNEFPMSKVGLEAGGCNPVPILDGDKTVGDEDITIPYATLQANAYRFPANWKS